MKDDFEDPRAAATPQGASVRILVPLMLCGSSVIMALAWLGHLRFKEFPIYWTILATWIVVLPEYVLNVAAIRLGYGTLTGGYMATLNLCTGVVCVALVSRLVLDEPLTGQKLAGFALMAVAMVLVATGPSDSEGS